MNVGVVSGGSNFTRIQELHRLGAMQSMARLASGQRINRAADDVAGLIASESLRATLAALDAESRSIQRTDAVASVAGGALEETSSLLHEANALAIASANTGGLSGEERAANQLQMDSIVATIDRVFAGSSFAGVKLFAGSMTLSAMAETQPLPAMSSALLGATDIDGTPRNLADVRFGGSTDLLTNPADAQRIVRNALTEVSTLRGKIGAFQHDTLRARMNGLQTAREQITRSVSMIRDADFALESASLLRREMLANVASRSRGIAMHSAQTVLSLLDFTRQAA